MIHCPHCGSVLCVKEEKKAVYHLRLAQKELHCLICCRTLSIPAWIAEDFRRNGPEVTCERWNISPKTLYAMPEVRLVRIKKLIGELPAPLRKKVLEGV